MRIPETFEVRRIPGGVGREFIREHHYSRSCHNGPMTWGLHVRSTGDLVGVLAFATPNSEAVRASVFGPAPEDKGAVTELHRLVVLEGTPTNTESWFIGQALRGLHAERPQYRAVLSFADGTEGHLGVIYQATNALYQGKTKARARFWRDGEGRLRHPRQNGHNVTPEEAADMGWTPEYRETKHRYLFLTGTPTQRKIDRKRLLIQPMPYPKKED